MLKISLKYALAHNVFHFPGPRWYKKGGRKLLLASRRIDDQRRRKTAGNISDGLRCCIWRRAENPAKMIHSLAGGRDNNKGGYIALLHPYELASRQPEFIAQHSVLAFLGKESRGCNGVSMHTQWRGVVYMLLPASDCSALWLPGWPAEMG